VGVPRLPRTTPRTISEITRRDIFDSLTLERVPWAGRLEEPDFLDSIYDLADMRSTDGRFKDAAGDIWQHRVNNPEDWEDDWVFTDSRFDLMHGDGRRSCGFLAEMVPAQGALRSLTTTVQRLAELRHELGLGHGRNQSSKALTRHARLAFNSASAIAEFMLDTWHSRRARDGNGGTSRAIRCRCDAVRFRSVTLHRCCISRNISTRRRLRNHAFAGKGRLAQSVRALL
jgi:AbiJ N-terminal domain 3/Abortive infection C-terminus